MLFYNEVEEEHEISCLQGTRVSRIEMGSGGTEIHVRWEIEKRVFNNEIKTPTENDAYVCCSGPENFIRYVTLRQ